MYSKFDLLVFISLNTQIYKMAAKMLIHNFIESYKKHIVQLLTLISKKC